AREVRDFAAAGFFIQALRIASFAYVERRIDKYLDETIGPAGIDASAYGRTVGPIGADKGGERYNPGRGEQLRHRADAANVFCPIFRGKGKPKATGKRLAVRGEERR